MIRFIITFFFLVLFLIISLPIQFVLWLIGFKWPNAKANASLKIVSSGFRLIIFLSGVDLTIIGEENVPKDRPVLYIANHRSYYDIILTYCRVPRQTGYIAKDAMQHVPSFSRWMRNLHCLFLDRKDLKKGLQTIKDAIKLIENGISVFVCPEGTRNAGNDTLLPFHEGTFKIATRTGCTLIPLTINNSDGVFEKQMPRIKKTHVILEYGSPIEVSTLSKEEKKLLPSTVKQIIETTYKNNQTMI